MNVNKILPFLLLLPFLASCTSKYKIEGTSSVNSLDGKMLYLKSLRDGEWVIQLSLQNVSTEANA